VVAPSFPVDDLARDGLSLVRAVGAVLVSVSALRCSALLLALPYALLVLCSCCTLRACSLVTALALLSPAADARASTALIDLRSRFLHTKKSKKLAARDKKSHIIGP